MEQAEDMHVRGLTSSRCKTNLTHPVDNDWTDTLLSVQTPAQGGRWTTGQHTAETEAESTAKPMPCCPKVALTSLKTALISATPVALQLDRLIIGSPGEQETASNAGRSSGCCPSIKSGGYKRVEPIDISEHPIEKGKSYGSAPGKTLMKAVVPVPTPTPATCKSAGRCSLASSIVKTAELSTLCRNTAKGCCDPIGKLGQPIFSTDTSLELVGRCCDEPSDGSTVPLSIPSVEPESAEMDSDSGLVSMEEDDKICPCCIETAVKALVSGQTLQSSTGLASRGSEAIRRCCRIFERNCARLPCCLPVSRERRRSRSQVKNDGREKKPIPGTTPCGKTRPTKRSTVDHAADLSNPDRRSTFRIEGMDCASCSIKVVRAVSGLETTRSVEVDYFASCLALEHNPHQIDAETIARFVSRATGFKVIPQLEDDRSKSHRMSLPIKTERPFTQDDTDKYTVLSKKGYQQVTFDPKVHPPRVVLQDLERFGATLISREHADDRKLLAKRAYHISLARSIVCGVMVIPALVMTWGSPNVPFHIQHGVAMATTTVIVLVSSSLVLGSIRSLIYLRHADVQLLVAVSTMTAYAFSIVAFGLVLAGVDFEHPFFQTPALLLTLVHIGGSVQAYARQVVIRAVASVQTLQPNEALLVGPSDKVLDDKEDAVIVDTRLLGYGDIIRVESDCVIAADGIIVNCEGTVDESCMTGESVPVVKGVGSLITAGCTNIGPPLDIHVSRLAHEDTAAKTIDLVTRAHQTRLPVQNFADRIAAIILPCTLAVAAISFLVWSLVSRLVREEASASSGILGLTYAIAVVAVACPCALVLVSPMVIAMVVTIGLRAGIIFRSTDALWSINDMDVFAFDKTGTLTEGRLRVLGEHLLSSQVVPLIAALVANQSHPISKAISAHIGCDPATIELVNQGLSDPVVVPGKGIQSSFEGFALLGGSAAYTQAAFESGQTHNVTSSVFFVTLGGITIARFTLQDMERPDVKELVRFLQDEGRRIIMISGDLAGPVDQLAGNIGILAADAHSQCSPAEKLSIIQDLQKSGARVCYVGDGANDAAALAAADISIAIGGGADLAQATADITFGSDRRLKHSLLSASALARLTRRHIKAGLTWSIIYNIFAVLLASGAFVTVRIAPKWAGLGELASLLPIFVIAFGTTLTWRFSKPTARG